ncbi:hypothetical protein BCD64_00075 [Nostoc sp. MBR 210]|nr:hypothetical protein BCD64_00075 [Nostoc sp. MBR 210]
MTKYAVGDRIITPSKKIGCVSSVHKKIAITWDNGLSGEYTPKQMQAWNYQKFLEDEQCNKLTSAQASAQDSHLPQQFLEDSNSLESQKLIVTVAASSANDSHKPQTTATCEPCQGAKLKSNGEKSTSSQLRRRANRSASKGKGKEPQTSVIVSQPSNVQLSQLGQDSSVSKTCQDFSTAQSSQGEQHSIFSTFYGRFPDSAMMLNGSVSVQGCLEVPTLESDFCWLDSPGALSTGKGRPPGQTKQEAQLKELKVLAPGEVCNPEFLESSCNLPLGWTDPQDERSALELIAEMGLSAIAAQPSEMHSTGELPPSPCNESNTSIHLSKIERTQESEPLILCPSCHLQQIYLSGGCGVCGLEPQTKQTKPKKQPKGCLYKYIEKKKFKDGSVIEYPRVEAGERDPDNPSHWRWGFNYEIKVNGKWKGRSIGSIPPDLILDIKLMQLDGASLEEIIKFIKLSKSKK